MSTLRLQLCNSWALRALEVLETPKALEGTWVLEGHLSNWTTEALKHLRALHLTNFKTGQKCLCETSKEKYFHINV